MSLVAVEPVAVPPTIDEFPSEMTVEEGHQMTFKVSVKGVPFPTFNWYHNDDIITDDYAHEIKQDGSLIIHKVEGKHEGTYHFVANNSAGTVDQKVTLTVAEVLEEGTADELKNVTKVEGVNIGPIPVKDFGEFVAKGHANSDELFKAQYDVRYSICYVSYNLYIPLQQLQSGDADHLVVVAVTPLNKSLNRFANVTVCKLKYSYT